MSILVPRVTTAIDAIWWPIARLGEAIEEAARCSGLIAQQSAVPLASPPWFRGEDLARWLDWAGEQLGIEAISVDAAVADLETLLCAGGPAIILYDRNEAQGFLLLHRSRRGEPQFLAPDLGVKSCAAHIISAALCAGFAEPLLPEIDRIMAAAEVEDAGIPRVRTAMLRERLSTQRVGGIWMLRLPASSGFWQQLRHARVPFKLGIVVAVFAALYLFEILGWKLIGSAAVGGQLDFGWLAAWVLLVLTMIPMRTIGGWFEAGFALDVGRILKSRLLVGALSVSPDTVKRSGGGHLIGRVMDSQALESLALNGGMSVMVSVMELGFAGWVLSQGAAAGVHLGLLLSWTALTLLVGWRFDKRQVIWSLQRLDMTNGLIEAMVGHRTRLAQERPDRRDAAEDAAMQAYLGASRNLDRSGLFAFSGIPSGWMLAGLAGLVPALVGGAAPSPASLAVSLGGIFVAQRAFGGITSGLAGISRARFAWGQVSGLFHAGHDNGADRPYLSAAQMNGGEGSSRLIDAQGLSFRYAGGDARIIDRADLIINRGDRILLEGESGGGKSTLAALLTGLQRPQSGLLLLNGLDRHTLGENWHRIATAAPQFHENHILSGTLAFNLLMGRQWPAPEADLREAEALCRELGLGNLLVRMPGGINQRVGETGWQLSHGERSRIFLARALLQKAPLTVMDESFAALDPETLERCLTCALQRAETLVVIAHP